MKKKIISAFLALALIVAMALPASAYNVAMARSWNGIYYATNDTCYRNRYHCVIESDSADHILRVDVVAQYDNGDVVGYVGYPAIMVANNYANDTALLDYIVSCHNIDGTFASNQRVDAN